MGRIDPAGHSLWITSSSSQARYHAKGWPKPPPKIPIKFIVKEAGPGMGMGVFATRDIKRFEPVLVERPLLVYPKRNSGLVNFDEAMSQLSEHQIRQLVDNKTEEVHSQFVKEFMEESARCDFFLLANSHKDDGSGPISGVVRTNGFSIGFGEKLPGADQDFGIGYGAVGKIASRFNHWSVMRVSWSTSCADDFFSCVADVVYAFDPATFTMRFIAVRDIKAGSQIFTSYTTSTETKAERQKALENYEFKCTCHSCVSATPQSDELRKFSSTWIENWTKEADNVWMKDDRLKESVLVPILETKRRMEEDGLDVVETQYPCLWSIMIQVYTKVGNRQKAGQSSDAFRNYYLAWVKAWEWANGDI
jgi:hypothetical protein